MEGSIIEKWKSRHVRKKEQELELLKLELEKVKLEREIKMIRDNGNVYKQLNP